MAAFRVRMLVPMLLQGAAALSLPGRPARPTGSRSLAVVMTAPPPPPEEPGHVFVVQGDLRALVADAVLYPTTSLDERKWFPDGPPVGAQCVARDEFTRERRVHMVADGGSDQPETWLGWLRYEGDDDAPVGWFTSAAEQFLRGAHAQHVRRSRPPLCDRRLPLLALPVVGTGSSGAKPMAGSLLAALLLVLTRFAAQHAVDVVLVTKSRRMFSAAQSVRLRLDPLAQLTAASHAAALCARLVDESDRLAALATSGQLVLFLGSGVSRTNRMPGWSELLGELAALAGFSDGETRQLTSLELKDQAVVLQHRLGTQVRRPGFRRNRRYRARRYRTQRPETGAERHVQPRWAWPVM